MRIFSLNFQPASIGEREKWPPARANKAILIKLSFFLVHLGITTTLSGQPRVIRSAVFFLQ